MDLSPPATSRGVPSRPNQSGPDIGIRAGSVLSLISERFEGTESSSLQSDLETSFDHLSLKVLGLVDAVEALQADQSDMRSMIMEMHQKLVVGHSGQESATPMQGGGVNNTPPTNHSTNCPREDPLLPIPPSLIIPNTSSMGTQIFEGSRVSNGDGNHTPITNRPVPARPFFDKTPQLLPLLIRKLLDKIPQSIVDIGSTSPTVATCKVFDEIRGEGIAPLKDDLVLPEKTNPSPSLLEYIQSHITPMPLLLETKAVMEEDDEAQIVKANGEDDVAIYIVTMKLVPAAHRNGDVKRFGSSWISNGISGTMNKLNKPKRNVSRTDTRYGSYLVRLQNSLLRRVHDRIYNNYLVLGNYPIISGVGLAPATDGDSMHNLVSVIQALSKGTDATNVGDEGDFAPSIQESKEGLELLKKSSAIEGFDEMPQQDVPSWTAVISAMVTGCRYKEMFELCCKMKMDGRFGDRFTSIMYYNKALHTINSSFSNGSLTVSVIMLQYLEKGVTKQAEGTCAHGAWRNASVYCLVESYMPPPEPPPFRLHSLTRKVCLLFCILHLLVGIMKSMSRHPSLWITSLYLALASSVFFYGFEIWMVADHEKQGHKHDLLNEMFWFVTFFESTSLIGSQGISTMLVKGIYNVFPSSSASAALLEMISFSLEPANIAMTGTCLGWVARTGGDVTLFIRDGYNQNHTDLRKKLDAGKDHGMSEGILMDGKGPYQYNNSLVPTGIDYETLNVAPGKTCRLCVHNLGIKTCLNFRIHPHNLLLMETEGAYSVAQSYSNLYICIGQSYSFLVMMHQSASNDSYVVASSNFVNESTWSRVTSIAILHYSKSKGKTHGPLPDPQDFYDKIFSMNQVRSIKTTDSVGAARPKLQGSAVAGTNSTEVLLEALEQGTPRSATLKDMIGLLKAYSNVVRPYAAIYIEKILSMEGVVQIRFNDTVSRLVYHAMNIGPFLFPLFTNLFEALKFTESVWSDLSLTRMFEEEGASWIQFEEPTLVLDLVSNKLEAFTKTYVALESSVSSTNVLIVSYFADVPAEAYKTLAGLSGISGFGFVCVSGAKTPDQKCST